MFVNQEMNATICSPVKPTMKSYKYIGLALSRIVMFSSSFKSNLTQVCLMDFLSTVCILSLSLVVSLHLISDVQANPNTFYVQDFGAVGDGKSDDSEAFQKAWNAACSATTDTATMIIPEGKTFLVYPVTLSGPCKCTTVNVMLSGIVKAPDDPSAWKDKDVKKWLVFDGIEGLNIDGFGQIDGSGQKWWDISCKLNPGKDCNHAAPTAFQLKDCDNVNMSNIHVLSSPQMHVVVSHSQNIFLHNLILRSPAKSPNTDGIHISNSNNVWVNGADIEVGDDCVSIGDRTTNIHVMYSKCGLGHGVSIGSLGENGEEVHVENIYVSHIQFYQTTNGGRIKTWQTGRGEVRNIEFSNLNFTEVRNPIIINQYYSDSKYPFSPSNMGVKISDVRYSNAIGTSATEVAINLNCCNNVPCTNITLEDVQLKAGLGLKDGKVISRCNNAFGFTKGVVEPPTCFK